MKRQLVSVLMVGCVTACTRAIVGPRGDYLDFIRADQRPPLVISTTGSDSLFGRATESERGDGIAESRRPALQALVERFAPTLILPGGDHVKVNGRRYWLLPTAVKLFTDTLRIDRVRASPYGFFDSQDIPFATERPEHLAVLADSARVNQGNPTMLEIWYFDFPGDNAAEWWATYGRLRTGPDSARWAQATIYAHPFVAADGEVVIQYWFFYPFNDYLGNHEGDTEHINVILDSTHTRVAEVHYFFHARSIRLPQGEYRPEVVDGTHTVVHVGGRAYSTLDYPNRIFSGDHNEGSHGSFPYHGEWEGAAGLGAPESVGKVDRDSLRVVRHGDIRVVLTPEPSRIDYHAHPEVLTDWAWLLLPIRLGYPSAPSIGAEVAALTDVGNHAPFSPAYNAGWNRTSPGLTYPAYHLERVPFLRSAFEDLLQPWYYLYVFRHPRYVPDTRHSPLSRRQLENLGLVPRGGSKERGMGSPLLGVHLASLQSDSADVYRSSTGISMWRSFWGKFRFGALELVGGYQKLSRQQGPRGSLFVYPFTANFVLRAPDRRFRPYATIGGGAYGWESRTQISGDTQAVTPGWALGWNGGVGLEYYLRPNLAIDVAVRYHQATDGTARARLGGDGLKFRTIWIGHYVRF